MGETLVGGTASGTGKETKSTIRSIDAKFAVIKSDLMYLLVTRMANEERNHL